MFVVGSSGREEREGKNYSLGVPLEEREKVPPRRTRLLLVDDEEKENTHTHWEEQASSSKLGS